MRFFVVYKEHPDSDEWLACDAQTLDESKEQQEEIKEQGWSPCFITKQLTKKELES